jgi:hypothetical protein
MPVIGTTAFNTAGDCFDLIRALLNDRDIPQIQTIPQNACVRNGNVTAIMLPVPHNLQIGSVVQVSFVDDPIFTGTQTVLTCPTPNQFTYANTGANATSGNGTVSLIIQGDVYMDAVLVPHVNKAFRKVQRKLLKGGSPTATDEITLTLDIGANVLSDSTLPQLPGDFIAPRTIREKVSGSANFYAPYLSRRNQLPDVPQGPYNCIYSWFDDELHFPGATQALDIVLRYEKGSQAISDATSVLTVRGCLDVVATYGAYYAARAHDSPKAETLMADAEQEMDEFLSSQAHARQYLPARRRPYGRSNRGRIRGWT